MTAPRAPVDVAALRTLERRLRMLGWDGLKPIDRLMLRNYLPALVDAYTTMAQVRQVVEPLQRWRDTPVPGPYMPLTQEQRNQYFLMVEMIASRILALLPPANQTKETQ